jgi:uncharacterized protein involved in outer membrane biogenesis
MKKLDLKPVFKVLTGLVAVAVIGLLIFSLTVDRLVKRSIENAGSEMLNTPVEVKDLSLSVLDGSGTIDGIFIQNPEGFSDEAVLNFRQISMKLNVSSLFSDTVIVEELIIDNPELYLEQQGVDNNIDKLVKNMEPSSSGDTKVIIERLVVNEGYVKLSSDIGEERTAEGTFSKIELADVGRQGNTLQQVMEQVLRPVLQVAAQEAVKEGLMDEAKNKLQDFLEN